jgi:GTP-binding protein EngB required for normal cell division
MSENKIAILGEPNTGKSTFFAVLDRALRDKGFTISNEGGEKAGERWLYQQRRYIARGYFPPRTKATAKKMDGAQITITSPHQDRYRLNFIDPPGELFENTSIDGEAEDPIRKANERAMKEHCEQATALMVLINTHGTPEQIRDNWRLTLEKYISLAVESESPVSRIAIVFTKADLLPWQSRVRCRFADEWICGHPELGDIYRDAHAIRCRATGKKPTVRFFFSSAIGWSRGQSNCRTTVISRDLTDGLSITTSVEWEDLIPDPAVLENDRSAADTSDLEMEQEGLGKPSVRGGILAGSFPPFTDPLRLVTEEVDRNNLGGRPVGVLTLPGRRHISNAKGNFISPWNIIEPMLWAGGYEHLSRQYESGGSLQAGDEESE